MVHFPGKRGHILSSIYTFDDAVGCDPGLFQMAHEVGIGTIDGGTI